MWWPEWKGLVIGGTFIYAKYAMWNAVCAWIAWVIVMTVADWYRIYFLLGCVLAVPGLLATTIEPGLIPIVWHGALGFFAAMTIAFRRFFDDLKQRWDKVPMPSALAEESGKVALEVRKELVKEMQWAFTTHLQIWIAFTAIFGVSMTILFKDGRINDADLKATAVQMSLGFGGCLSMAYIFGLAHALRVMQSVRRGWIEIVVGDGGPPTP